MFPNNWHRKCKSSSRVKHTSPISFIYVTIFYHFKTSSDPLYNAFVSQLLRNSRTLILITLFYLVDKLFTKKFSKKLWAGSVLKVSSFRRTREINKYVALEACFVIPKTFSFVTRKQLGKHLYTSYSLQSETIVKTIVLTKFFKIEKSTKKIMIKNKQRRGFVKDIKILL